MRIPFLRSALSLAILCAALAAVPSPAQDPWVPVAQSADGTLAVSVDSRRIQRTPYQLDVWLRFAYSGGARTQAGTPYRHSLSRTIVDCAGMQTRMLQSVYYDALGNVVGSWEDARSPWEPAGPQTVMAMVIATLCGEPARAAMSPVVHRFGALAVGGRTGWSVDYATQDEADARALSECGSGCRVVVRIAGPQCGAYATSPSAYGWATADTRAQAEANALANCARNTRRGQRCAVAVWACNGRP